MMSLLLTTVFFYKTETKLLNEDRFGFGKTIVACDSGSVRLKGKYYKTDSTFVIRRAGVIKTYYWYEYKNAGAKK
jgi:hypothetical protein